MSHLSRSLLRLRFRPYSSSAAAAARISPAEALQVITAVPRNESGKGWAGRARKQGLVPSIVFEQEDGHLGGNKRLIALRADHLRNIVDAHGRDFFLSRLFRLCVRSDFNPDSETLEDVRVLPRLLHYPPTGRTPSNVTFIRAPSEALLRVNIPIEYTGEDVSPGLKKGCYLNKIKRTVKFLCPADLIPPFIEVDLSELDSGQRICAKDLKVHQLLLPLIIPESPICKIAPARGSGDPQKKSK